MMFVNRIAALFLALLVFSSCQPQQDVQTEVTQAAAEVMEVKSATQADLPEVAVYKTPTCGCCSLWVDHLKEAGFTVNTTDLDDLHPIKDHFGVKGEIQSCHTAIVGGYVVEGHVPADVVKQMLEEKPDIAGIAVPGMPIGSPGMEVEGRPADKYNVIAFKKDGSTSVYAER